MLEVYAPPVAEDIRLPAPATQAEFFAYRDATIDHPEHKGLDNIRILEPDKQMLDIMTSMSILEPGEQLENPEGLDWHNGAFRKFVEMIFDYELLTTDEDVESITEGVVKFFYEEPFEYFSTEQYHKLITEFAMKPMGGVSLEGMSKARMELAKKLLLGPNDETNRRLRFFLFKLYKEKMYKRYTKVARLQGVILGRLVHDTATAMLKSDDFFDRPGMDVAVLQERTEQARFVIKDPVRFAYDWYALGDKRPTPNGYYSPATHSCVYPSYQTSRSTVVHEINHAWSAASYTRKTDGSIIVKRNGHRGRIYKKSPSKNKDVDTAENEAETQLEANRYLDFAPLDENHAYVHFRRYRLGLVAATKIINPEAGKELERLFAESYWQQSVADEASATSFYPRPPELAHRPVPVRSEARKARNQLMDMVFAPGFRNLVSQLMHDDAEHYTMEAFENFGRDIEYARELEGGGNITARDMLEILKTYSTKPL